MTSAAPQPIAVERSLAARPSRITGVLAWARKLVLKQLSLVEHGSITMHDATGTVRLGAVTEQSGLSARVHVHDASAYLDLLLGGSVGAGESYAEGAWTTDDLPSLCRIIVANEDVVHGLDRGLTRLRAPMLRLFSRTRRNDRSGSRRNIAAHYDLGNEFFELMLDDTMMYSAGVFERPEASMREASEAKLQRVCDKLDLTSSDHLIEIGTGWGGLAVFAAQHYGCRVTTTTISREQAKWARERVQREGVQDLVTVVEKDYRDLTGSYDKLVSIEMIEAIGGDQYRQFFRKCDDLLKPNGLMVVQAITIGDQRFEEAKDEVEFIKHHIFPGSCIPSITALSEAMTSSSALRMVHLEDITRHYAETLRRWRAKFHDNLDVIRRQGRPERFLGLWDFYLAYCEAAFEERYLGDVQLVFAKPGWRGDLVVGRRGERR